MDSSMLVASELATRGSVIANADLMVPSSSGLRYFSRCSSVPNSSSTSMLPVSGALQLQASGAMKLRPMISASGAYSRFVRPAPVPGWGWNRFHSPRFRASVLSSSMIGGWKCGSPDSRLWSSAAYVLQQRRLVAAHPAQPALVIGGLLTEHVQHGGVRQDQEAFLVDRGEDVAGDLGGFEHLAGRGDGAGGGDAARIAGLLPGEKQVGVHAHRAQAADPHPAVAIADRKP